MTEFQKMLYKTLFRKSFYEFVKYFWKDVEPAEFVDGILIEFYCEIFQYMCRPWIGYKEIDIKVPEASEIIDVIDVREDKNKLNINVPPRHTKSMIFNVFGPVWLDSILPVLAASVSHTEPLATKMNTKRQKILNSPRYKELYSEVILESNTNGLLKDTRGGELYSINRNAFTGYGADIIINDDLTNAEAAKKDKEEMSNAWSYYCNTMPSRINNPNKYIIMNIQQRLAPNDITGHILETPSIAKEYTFVVLPAIFEKDTYIVFPISGKIHLFKKGDCLWPERFGNYESLRNQVGETVFQTQYLQKPIASDRTIIKLEMIKEKDATEVYGYDTTNNRIDPLAVDMIYASHDFPVKDKETSDFLGSTLGYVVGSTLYVVDALEQRMAFVKSRDYAIALDSAYPGSIQIIEDKANGAPILQQLQADIPGLQAFQTGCKSKTQRLESASVYLTSGNVVFVKTVYNKITNSWDYTEGLKILIKKLLKFPFLDHDDIVDSFSQLVLFVFMDKFYQVYGRSFNDGNIVSQIPFYDYSTIFFNKEGSSWKMCEIGVQYSYDTKLIVLREEIFKGDTTSGINALKAFSGKPKVVCIDCSFGQSLSGVYQNNVTIEKYDIEDFEKSVGSLDLAFANNRFLISNECKKTISDIINFKYDKSKDDNIKKFRTEKDGLVSCLRIALKYYGIS